MLYLFGFLKLTVILVGEKSSKTYKKQVCGEQAKID
jgi:hypothetical protein